jgi:hypothetical protein
MGLWEQLTNYLWNYQIMMMSAGYASMCLMLTAWGVFWGDDDGVMGNECFKMFGGFSVNFPVNYKFVSGVTLN